MSERAGEHSGDEGVAGAETSLVRRIVLAVAFLGGAVILAVLLTWWQVYRLRADSAAVEVAGRLRLLSERLPRQALAGLQGDFEAYEHLGDSVEDFDQALKTIAQGDAARGIPEPSPRVRERAAPLEASWGVLARQLREMLSARADEQRLHGSLDFVDENNHAVLQRAEELERVWGAAGVRERAARLQLLGQGVARVSFEIERGGGEDHARELRAFVEAFERTLLEIGATEAGGDSSAGRAVLGSLSAAWRELLPHARVIAADGARHREILERAGELSAEATRAFGLAQTLTVTLADEAEERVWGLLLVLGGSRRWAWS